MYTKRTSFGLTLLWLLAGAHFVSGCGRGKTQFSSTKSPEVAEGRHPSPETDSTARGVKGPCTVAGLMATECVETKPEDDTQNPVATTVVATSAPTPNRVARPGGWVEVTSSGLSVAKVDILWAIDSSNSMSWAQQALASKFQLFAQELRDASVDFQLGVTSLDVCRQDKVADAFCPEFRTPVVASTLRGSLVPIPGTSLKYFDSTTPEFVEKFKQQAILGVDGSSFEQGLSAVKFAVQKSASGGENFGFIRPDARLSVIVLSDEEDDGIGFWEEYAGGGGGNIDFFKTPSYPLVSPWKTMFDYADQHMTADRFVAEMNGLKGAGKFQVNAITGMRDGEGKTFCSLGANGVPVGPREEGTNYRRASQLTGGVAENICGNWDSILQNIGRSTVDLTRRVALSKPLFEGTLEVYVNGTLWTSGYSYDKSTNAVVFKTLPPSESTVLIRFREVVQ